MATTIARRNSVLLNEVEAAHLNAMRIPAGSKIIIRSKTGKDYVLPAELQVAIREALRILSEDGEVRMMRTPDELTSSSAAELLGVTRPTLMKWAREGKIPSFKAGTHTRFKREDVLDFKRHRDQTQVDAFDRMRAFEMEEFGPVT